jgi:hypothetical protein
MDDVLNWSKFYNLLNKVGPEMLTGLNEDLKEFLIESGTQTDDMYSEQKTGAIPFL